MDLMFALFVLTYIVSIAGLPWSAVKVILKEDGVVTYGELAVIITGSLLPVVNTLFLLVGLFALYGGGVAIKAKDPEE